MALTERKLYRQLNPVGPAKLRLLIKEDQEAQRHKQQSAAYHFLVTGAIVHPHPCLATEQGPGRTGDSGYKVYNPRPYPEAAPLDPEMYEGTGIGALYNIQGSRHHLWQLAGWTLTRAGAEQRARRK